MVGSRMIKNLISRGEEKVAQIVNGILSNPTFSTLLDRSMERLILLKDMIDKQMKFALHTIQLPSRSDYDDLGNRVDTISIQLQELREDLYKINKRLGKILKPLRQPRGPRKVKMGDDEAEKDRPGE